MRALLVFVLGLVGCGGVSFQANTLPSNAVTASGLASIVQLTAVSDGNGTLINVTVVTLTQAGAAQTFTFCGTQSSLFPMNQTIRVSFVPAENCGNIVVVARF